MNTGTIIEIKTQIRNYPERDGERWESRYHQLMEGDFEVVDSDLDHLMKFNGQHFICLGDTYFGGTKGYISGFELLDDKFEIVPEAPKDLKP